MLDKKTMVKITNRDSGSAGYTIEEMNNLHRNFAAGETKEVPMEEIRALSYLPGGMEILEKCFVINNPEAVKEIYGDVEPEYTYTAEDVKILLTEGTNEQLMDCLDFAPEGVINLVQQIAVETKLNDVSKRKIIFEKTGFNIDKAIEINDITKEEEENTKETKSARRAQPVSQKKENTEKVRKAELPSYKDLKKNK